MKLFTRRSAFTTDPEDHVEIGKSPFGEICYKEQDGPGAYFTDEPYMVARMDHLAGELIVEIDVPDEIAEQYEIKVASPLNIPQPDDKGRYNETEVRNASNSLNPNCRVFWIPYPRVNDFEPSLFDVVDVAAENAAALGMKVRPAMLGLDELQKPDDDDDDDDQFDDDELELDEFDPDSAPGRG